MGLRETGAAMTCGQESGLFRRPIRKAVRRPAPPAFMRLRANIGAVVSSVGCMPLAEPRHRVAGNDAVRPDLSGGIPDRK